MAEDVTGEWGLRDGRRWQSERERKSGDIHEGKRTTRAVSPGRVRGDTQVQVSPPGRTGARGREQRKLPWRSCACCLQAWFRHYSPTTPKPSDHQMEQARPFGAGGLILPLISIPRPASVLARVVLCLLASLARPDRHLCGRQLQVPCRVVDCAARSESKASKPERGKREVTPT